MARLVLALLFCGLPIFASAQELASLVADRVRVEADSRLIAEGSVEVLYRDARLKARRIVYDRETDRLDITGPITLEDGGRVLVVAEAGAMDADLRNGILTSARVVLDRQLQLAATRIARVGGRYTRLSDTVASSCEVCASDPTPSWEIRARTIIHDQQERLLYFDDATFRLFGVPVAYFPRLRLPDASRSRATGLLIPRIRTTSQLGTGIKLPVFVTLGEHADVTLTPYLSSSTTTLETEYRQALRFGDLSLRAAASRDDLEPERRRWYVFGEGRFDLPRGFRLEFDIEEVSDDSYLIDYDYSEQDRLTTELRLIRARRDELISASLSNFESLRDSERAIRDRLPSRYGRLDYERRLDLGRGELRLGVDASVLDRESEADIAGRDVTTLGLSASWLRRSVLRAGLVSSTTVALDADSYDTNNDRRFEGTSGRITPSISTELRLPMARTGAGGVRHLLEPVMQLAWSMSSGDPVPNEDSVLAEFDEGNLYSVSRYPGSDRLEEGTRASLGLGYTAIAPGGWSAGLALGRILRSDESPDFAPGSGLDGRSSDWLASVNLSLGERVQLANRALFDDGVSLSKNEARVAYRDGRFAAAGSYVWLEEEPRENRPLDTHELSVDAEMRLSRHWTGILDTRFDLTRDRAARAGIGLQYRSECLIVDMSLSRRFTETDSLEPTTEFGLGLRLAGFGTGQADESYRKTCNG